MVAVNLNNLELNEFVAKNNPGQRCRATFPILGVHGTKQSATVYVELDPDEELGTHTDSAEELLLVLDGSIEAVIGNEKAEVSKGGLVLVPKMIQHNFRNTGKDKAKVIGFFGGANNIVATFEETWLPANSNIVDTAKVTAEVV